MFDLNDAQLDFDPFSDFAAAPSTVPSSPAMQAMDDTEMDDEHTPNGSPTDEHGSAASRWKGKGVSRPMDIPLQSQPELHDIFDVAESSSTSHRDREYFTLPSPISPSSLATSSGLPDPHDVFEPASSYTFSHFSSFDAMEVDDDPPLASSSKGKGKEKEQPPTLPPLTFTRTELLVEPSSVAGPSSSSTALLSPIDLVSAPKAPVPVLSTPTTTSRLLFRRRSLPSLAGSNPGTAKPNKHRSKTGSSTLARKLLFRKYDGDSCPTPPSSPTEGQTTVDLGAGSCFAPWRNDSVLRLEYDEVMVKTSSRHQSLPFPVSALDLIPISATDIFNPIPLPVKEVINYFDDVLPRELRVHVLLALIVVHEAEHARAVRDGQWTVMKASSSRNKWVGRDKALRELVRFSRVSKAWQALVFDGQIWANLDLHAFPLLPKSLLLRIARSAGSFIQDVNVAGHVSLSSGTLIEVTDNLSALSVRSGSLPFTYITGLNLRGCSSISTRSLHHLLIQSRSLARLCLKGLSAVTNTTCEIIGVYCPNLVALDLGRCPNIDASGLRSLTATFALRGEYMLLKELRLSGLKHLDDSALAALGRAAPFLEVLDLSYCRGLHNTAVEALVACGEYDSEDPENGIKIVTLNAREAGRSVDEGTQFRRRITRLRHLILSSCILLTDAACSHLAHAVPKLEYLELAGIGNSLDDDGLIRLLETTPLLSKLDLEDASAITDAVLATLTPALDEGEDEDDPAAPQSPLEHLVISGAVEVTEDALLALIRGCKKLRVLEADNTRIGPIIMKTFVRTLRQREISNAKFVAIDCRGFGEQLLKELSVHTRPRQGWAAYGARHLGFLDARDGQAEDLRAGHGQDELDEKRIVVKTFYGWQTVDAVQAAREKRRKARTRRTANESFGSDETDAGSSNRTRWWSPGGRRSPPAAVGVAEPGEGCVIM
uniref:RNI-like protein n=1 Tax=Mycena chlorophos TaxID=658473 RepID=A0ABQ0L8F1_MYCCL|nr:predicted protein [Mycena chlorophos]